MLRLKFKSLVFQLLPLLVVLLSLVSIGDADTPEVWAE